VVQFVTAIKKESIMAQMATKSAPLSTRAPASTVVGPIKRDAIAALAFQKWQQRGCPIGEDHLDWFEAEKELTTTLPSQRQAK
jgi:hypothetical protein